MIVRWNGRKSSNGNQFQGWNAELAASMCFCLKFLHAPEITDGDSIACRETPHVGKRTVLRAFPYAGVSNIEKLADFASLIVKRVTRMTLESGGYLLELTGCRGGLLSSF